MLEEKIPEEKTTNENVRLQNLRDFTVQILDKKSVIVGTGIAVSMDGRIATCRHVVEEAINNIAIEGAEVGVYFPQARGEEKKKRKAVVEKFFKAHNDDAVMLKLKDGASPLAPEQIAVLGYSDYSEGNQFLSFGYGSIEPYQAIRAGGMILGSVPPPPDVDLRVDPMQLQSRQIDAGMSGSAVLDTKRNLVIGLVAERYFPAKVAIKDDVSWAADAKILTFDPFDLELRVDPLPLQPAPSPKADKEVKKKVIEAAEETVAKRSSAEKFSWNSAPTVLPEWTGRDDLLAQITEDWNDPQKHVTGLIGFGGEGKSSLARKWVDDLCRGGRPSAPTPPDGVFWWGFYENRSIDEFLEAALNFLSGGRIDPRQVPSSSLRAQIIGAMLGAGRYLFVLDGLEVLQHQEGDQYGLLQSNDLRDLLTYFARPDNQSFCLITSRAPVLDLMDYTTYTHRDVDRLSQADGIALLKKLGVHPSPPRRGDGGEVELAKVVSDWDGHALTISLLGSYLAEKYGGDIAHLADIPIPTADEPRYERVHRVLRRYDEHLTAAEREFLKLFSAFRTPVHESAFEKVFAPLLTSYLSQEKGEVKSKKSKGIISRLFKSQSTDSPITNLPITDIVSRLVTYRILHCDTTSQTYTAHPLVRNHYLAFLTHGDSTEQHDVHGKIKDYYLSIAGDTPQYPTLEDLKPLIEVVHHMCEAEAYEEAFNDVYWNRIQQSQKATLVHQLGAYDTDLNILFEFFLNRDSSQESQVNNASHKRWILNEIGLCLMSLGRLREAVLFYERSAKIALNMQDWSNASITYGNLAEMHGLLGALEASAEAARQALDLACRAKNEEYQTKMLVRRARADYLLGKLQIAGDAFSEAENLLQEVKSNLKYLYSQRGIQHADYLRRTAQYDYAFHVTKANLQICEQQHWGFLVSQCHRILGDLDFDSGNLESARTHYESALKIARSISKRDVLIEALLARGRFFAKVAVGAGSPRPNDSRLGSGDPTPTVNDAFTDLNEALNYAVEGGYRIYEADIRVALAWAHLASYRQSSIVNGLSSAKAEATRALQMSQEMGYHWGKVDAEEILNYEG